MEFKEAVAHVFSNYATFNGRACRSEYWWFVLFSFLAGIVTAIISAITMGGGGPLMVLLQLALFLPGLAVAVRRLHDIDKSGWWYLIILIPLIGAIVLMIWFCRKGTVGPNRFGEDHSQVSTDIPPQIDMTPDTSAS